MKIFCHHLNFPFNSGIKKIAKPINSIPINAIRTEAAVITNRVRRGCKLNCVKACS